MDLFRNSSSGAVPNFIVRISVVQPKISNPDQGWQFDPEDTGTREALLNWHESAESAGVRGGGKKWPGYHEKFCGTLLSMKS